MSVFLTYCSSIIINYNYNHHGAAAQSVGCAVLSLMTAVYWGQVIENCRDTFLYTVALSMLLANVTDNMRRLHIALLTIISIGNITRPPCWSIDQFSCVIILIHPFFYFTPGAHIHY